MHELSSRPRHFHLLHFPGDGVALVRKPNASPPPLLRGGVCIVGSGPQLKPVGGGATNGAVGAGFFLVANVDLGGFARRPAEPEPPADMPGWKSSAGRSHSDDGPSSEDLLDGADFDLTGVSDCLGGVGAAEAVVFRGGLARAVKSARLSFWADRSALRAEAVLAATEGVTWRAGWTGVTESRERRLEPAPSLSGSTLSLEMRDVRKLTSVDS